MCKSLQQPVFKLHNCRYFKRLVHTRNRMLERSGIYLTSRQYRYIVNPWDICDYSFPIYPCDIARHSDWYTPDRVAKARRK